MDTTGSLPAGTVTFLFTDIEGSTRLWEQHPAAMEAALTRHDALAAATIALHEGYLVKQRGEGDSLFTVFARAVDAVAATLALQQALAVEPWPEGAAPRVRMALHTGDAAFRAGDYFGPAVNRCARLRAVAYGGQILLSSATQELTRDALPAGASLRDLGEHRLRDLARPERIFQLLHPALPADFPPLASLNSLPHNLPQQVTSFIGREKEMAEVRRLLATTRLLTLTGSGGTGKTRVSLQVAADLLEGEGDGVWLVELAPLADPALVPQAVATALGLREEPGKPLSQSLVDFLKPKRLLLLLDNCEHLLAACAELAEAILRSCPGVQILATSREGLNIAGETTYRLPSLTQPDLRQPTPSAESLSQYEAVRLFIDRSTAAVPSFAITNQNAPAVAQLCVRLDGIPLAIELAAARVKALSVEQINARIADMFRLLTGGSRTALPRQQTLRAAIDWSYDLLSEKEKILLRRLSVFAGGWTLEAAEQVGADPEEQRAGNVPSSTPPASIENWEGLDLLTALVQKSLVVYEEDEQGHGRYRLLETIRQYGQEKLEGSEEAVAARDRHRDWYLARAEQAELDLRADHENLEAALEWSMQRSDAEAALRLAEALHGFWFSRGYMREGRERLEKALALPGAQAPTAARAQALTRAGYWAFRLGDYQGARELLEGALMIGQQLGDQHGPGGALFYLGHVAMSQGDYQAARALYEEALPIYRQQDQAAWPLLALGDLANLEGDYEGARALAEESLAIFRQRGDWYGIGVSLCCLGDMARNQGDYQGARALYEESLEFGGGDTTSTLKGLAAVARSQGDYKEATAFYKESLGIHRRTGDQSGVAYGLEGLAGVAAADDQAERAARLFGAAEALRESIGAPLPPDERAHYDRYVAATHTALGQEAFAAAWAEGRAMTLEQAVAYALEGETLPSVYN